MRTHRRLRAALLLLSGASVFLFSGQGLRAQTSFQTGFETSSGYTSGSTIVGVQDGSAPSGVKWTNMFGSDATMMTASPANPGSGSLGFQINDTSTGTAYGVSLNLGSTSIASSAFTLQFSMALSNLGGSGSAAQIYLGAAATGVGTNKYWTALTVDAATGLMVLYVDSATGGSSTGITLGSYTTYANYGQYINFSISIDPSTMKYTGVTLSGALSSADKFSAVQASNGGVVPWRHDTTTLPGFNLDVVAGTGSTATIAIDNISLFAVPEASTWAMLGLGLAFLVWAVHGKKRVPLSPALPVLYCLFAASAGASAADPRTFARLDLSGSAKDQVELAVEGVSEGGKAAPVDWAGADKKTSLTSSFPATEVWQKGSITIKATKSGNVSLIFRGPYIPVKADSKELVPVFMAYDNLEMDGAVVKNGSFEQLNGDGSPRNFSPITITSSNPPLTEALKARVVSGNASEGDKYIRVWHNATYGMNFFAEENVPVKITFSYRLAGE